MPCEHSKSRVTLSLGPLGQSTASVGGSSPWITHQKQEGEQSRSPTFEFINTTTDVQYSGPGSRSAARSHVMRNFHKRKGKSRPEHARLWGQGSSLPALANPLSHEVSSPNTTYPVGIEVYGQRVAALRQPDENATESEEKTSGLHNDLELWLPVQQHQKPPELPMSNPWALPIDQHAGELISHCKRFLIYIFLVTACPFIYQYNTYPVHVTISLSCTAQTNK
jgi:hypothetical protein